MKVSLVIPAYNENSLIKDTVKTCLDHLRSNFGEWELIVVDDGSTDGTADAAREASGGEAQVISYPENRGKGCAVRTGVLASKGDVVIYTDADLAYGLEVVPAAVAAAEDCDVVIGSRRLHKNGYAGYTPMRLLASRVFGALVRVLSGMDYDTQCGFKCFKRQAADRVFSMCRTDGFAFDFEAMMLARRLGLTVKQLPVTIINHRQSKVHLMRDAMRMLRDVAAIRSRVSKTLKEATRDGTV